MTVGVSNEAYAIINNRNGNNFTLIHNFTDKNIINNLNNLKDNEVIFKEYEDLLKSDEYLTFIKVLKNYRNNICTDYQNYIDLLNNLYLQSQDNNTLDVKGMHNIAKDREYKILMSVIYETRDSF